MSRVLDWIRATIFKLRDLISRRSKVDTPEEPPVLTELDKKLGRKIQKRQAEKAELAQPVDTRHGGPNMPKRQPCPRGHGWKRRKQKTMGGAYYGCRICGDFFIRSRA
jgi:hypothetical protein